MASTSQESKSHDVLEEWCGFVVIGAPDKLRSFGCFASDVVWGD